MEHRNLKKLLFDVEKACKRIEKFVSNRSLDDFLHGYTTVLPTIVRGIVTNDVPILLSEVRSFMGEL